MREINIIDAVQTECAAPIQLSPKKDGAPHFCMDYWKRNAISARDSNSIQITDECIDSLGDAGVCSTLDEMSEIWKIEVDEQDRN